MATQGINKVILIGRLGQDPDSRTMPNGDMVTRISMATSESWKDRNTGEPQERTEWHRVVFFGKLAEIVAQYLKKGSKIYVEGKLQTRKWQDQQGQDRYTTEVVVDGFRGQMQMLDRNSSTAAGAAAPTQQPAHGPQVGTPRTEAGTEGQGGPDVFDDDICF